ncbi:hypothetical protein [Moraxella boevrei]|uniref:hypothetical protein n=1 Tax=Faucicola boevrei TaxID=346665 RepID=UPI003735FC56
MSTLVLKSTSTIKNPRFGKLPDLDTGLRFALDARELNLSNGAEVSRWVASRGIGNHAEKVFSQKNSNHNYPVFDNTAGRNSVKFSGNEQLMNDNQDYFVGSASYIVVGKCNNLAPAKNGVARIFCGDIGDKTDGMNAGNTADQWQQVAPFNNGIIMMTGSTTQGTSRAMGDTLAFGTDWFVGVFVFDGENSKMLSSLSDMIVKQPKLVHSRQDRVGMGISLINNDVTTSGFDGYISYLAQYERALTDTEMKTAIEYFKSEFNI